MNDEGVGGEPQPVVTVDYVFDAKFDSGCPICHLGIHVGQSIAKLSNDRYVHEGCAPGARKSL